MGIVYSQHNISVALWLWGWSICSYQLFMSWPYNFWRLQQTLFQSIQSRWFLSRSCILISLDAGHEFFQLIGALRRLAAFLNGSAVAFPFLCLATENWSSKSNCPDRWQCLYQLSCRPVYQRMHAWSQEMASELMYFVIGLVWPWYIFCDWCARDPFVCVCYCPFAVQFVVGWGPATSVSAGFIRCSQWMGLTVSYNYAFSALWSHT